MSAGDVRPKVMGSDPTTTKMRPKSNHVDQLQAMSPAFQRDIGVPRKGDDLGFAPVHYMRPLSASWRSH